MTIEEEGKDDVWRAGGDRARVHAAGSTAQPHDDPARLLGCEQPLPGRRRYPGPARRSKITAGSATSTQLLAHRHRVSLIDSFGPGTWEDAPQPANFPGLASTETVPRRRTYDGPGIGVRDGVFSIGPMGLGLERPGRGRDARALRTAG